METKVLLSGCTGRMGLQIKDMICQNPEAWLYSYGVTRSPRDSNEVSELNSIEAHKVDVVIDFSLPAGFEVALSWAIENKKPFLSGTTGLSEAQDLALQEASKSIPVLLAANTSLGINVVNSLIPSLVSLKSFDFQIVEAHHNKKIDAPSGTARLLQNTLTSTIKKDIPSPLAVRGGGIYGEHEIRIMSDEEVIVIKHTALNRQVFAKGALIAAQWLVSQKPGRYSMADVLQG